MIKFSTACVRKFEKNNKVELLVNPCDMRFAVRTAAKDSRHSVVCSRVDNGILLSEADRIFRVYWTLFELFDWNADFKYRISGFPV